MTSICCYVKRIAAMLLNTTMHACRWIQDQHAKHRSESWRNGVEEYLKYNKEIQIKFPVAVDKHAADTGRVSC